MKRNRRISTVAVLTLAAFATATGTGLAATTTATASPATETTAAAPAVSAAPTRAFQGALPAPTGHYAAGEDVIHLTDQSRPDPWVPSSGPRQLTVSMFYPAVAGTGTEAPYMTLAEAAGYIEHRAPANSGLTPQGVAGVTTHAFDGAQPRNGKYPLVILSPGFENPRMTLTGLATELASRGYVVALVGHTYEDSGETLANGQTPSCPICDGGPMAPAPDTIAASRALDVSFVLDQLTHGNTAWPLAHLIDKNKIGMAGHSIGGAAAVTTMLTDPRVQAGVNLDGGFFPVPVVGQIRRPFLMLGKDSDHTVSGDDYSWPQTWAALYGYKKWLAVAGANHASFTDVPILAAEAGIPMPPGIDAVRGMVITREYVTAFFDQTLKGIHSNLLDGPSPANPDVLFQY